MEQSLDNILRDLIGETEERLFNAQQYHTYKQAAHCFIYAESNEMVFSQHHVRANVLMLMRFDGKLGFPGGLVERHEDIVEGLNRELHEEINLDTSKFHVYTENHVISHVNHGKQFCNHLYFLKLLHPEYCEMEKRILDAKEYGNETLGLLRVPLYTYCHNRGFPAFLQNGFIGNAKSQLLYALGFLQIMTTDEITSTIKLSQA